MFGLNRAEVIGRLGADAAINHLASGGRVANMSIATDESYLDKNTGERHERTEWHRVVTFQPGLVDMLKNHPIAISMDGKGRWVDNVFIERLWRSVKYEDVYLRAYETPAELRAGLARYFEFYNSRRRHSALGRRTPDAVYYDRATPEMAA